MALQLAFEVTGEGPPLLVLHGLFGSGNNWRSVARALASTHRVYCVDLRNHGASPWADTMGYAEMADDVRALIADQGLGRPAVVGHSMGGKTAMALALESPEVLGHLVVVDIVPVAYGDRMSPYVEAMRSLDATALASRTEAQRRLLSMIPEPAVVPFLLQNLVARNDHFDWRLNLAAIGAAVPALSSFPPDLLSRRYEGPATLIAGANSNYVSATDVPEFKRLFPRATVHTIAGAGHWVHADKPADFVTALRLALG
ncbi:AB hydrolase-1 domain-containing protein [Rubrivivax sp. A210]|uniref:alpha/beta fold hydrolase n=1 Tax=Rubrivivax sp. A210 TaxID=2772301 RepID=UPI001917D101|nr:alpha/beta fold hydrolase [Rubrivivax sp. A210]CAD5366324.1 AB hydrolase-1 domain-containing protein [Rubrivivax sp. A210]